MLAGRDWDLVRRNILASANWRALERTRGVMERPVDHLSRYLTGRGDYPYAPGVRTPAGRLHPTLWSHHDVFTLHEVFCREDYRAGPGLRTVVDVGSNIGLSALYFLSRAPEARVRCFEPVPRNAERLRKNLAPFQDRWTLEEAAVDETGGMVSFGTEPTGRYGGVDVTTGRSLQVPSRPITAVLDEVLADEPHIDLLKIDTEGAELRTVLSIRPDQRARIGTIYFEWLDSLPLELLELGGARRDCDTVRLGPLSGGRKPG